MKRIESLDALRAVAALSVFFYHIKELANNRLGDFMWFGWMGVELFFVLSGFFIGMAVLAPKTWNPLTFLQRRLRRIVPAFYVSIFFSVVLVNSWFIMNEIGWEVIFRHLFMIHSFFVDSAGTINGAYWTLGVEFFFYLLMMITAPLLRSRWIGVVLASWVVVCYGWRVWLLWYGANDALMRFFIGTQLPGMLDLFVIGVVLAWITLHRDWIQRGVQHYRIVGILFLVGGGLLFAYCVNYLGIVVNRFWFDPFAVVFWRTLVGLSFGAIIIAFTVFDQSSAFRTLLEKTGIAYLGRISYSIYLFHIPIILSLHRAEVPTLPTTDWKMALMMTIVMLLISMASYHFVEEPLYRPTGQRKEAVA